MIKLLGCVIPPFLSQIISASISFAYLQFQDTQNAGCWSLMIRNQFDPIAQYPENVQNMPKYR